MQDYLKTISVLQVFKSFTRCMLLNWHLSDPYQSLICIPGPKHLVSNWKTSVCCKCNAKKVKTLIFQTGFES